MSVFDYPRINFTGIITLNPGTANNDDYSGQYHQPGTGENLALMDSTTVEPRTFGMSDDDFLDWIQKERKFDSSSKPPRQPMKIIPAEWNYYGDMNSSVDATVVGVQTEPTTPYRTAVDSAPLSSLIGETVNFTGNITDINSEGSPPGTQFFIHEGSVKIGEDEINGAPSKASCLWINFLRNVNLTGDSGSGGYIYHVIEGGHVALPGFDDPDIIGLVLRYYVFAKHGTVNKNEEIEKLYEQKTTNPAKLQITGSFMPLYRREQIRSMPVGRQLTCDTPNIATPLLHNNSKGKIALAPAVMCCEGDLISVDFLGSFPENFNACDPEDWGDPSRQNPKFDFGPIALEVRGQRGTAVVGPVPYTDTDDGNARGWVFDFDISNNTAAKQVLADSDASFYLRSEEYGDVLCETDYYIVSNQLGIYAEQGEPGDLFVTQGLPKEAATISVFHRGAELSGEQCPPIKVWSYRTIPLGFSGDRKLIDSSFGPGKPLQVGTEEPGNYLFTFAVAEPNDPTAGEPPPTYADYIAPPFMILANRPAISLRVLPNEDFSQYWDEGPDGPIGNDSLSFDVVFEKVLRTYYLLYPAMNAVFPLNDGKAVACAAKDILKRTDLDLWRNPGYMPITRDLSESRRTLLQAWCRKVIRDEGHHLS